jgi:hypothetical protein
MNFERQISRNGDFDRNDAFGEIICRNPAGALYRPARAASRAIRRSSRARRKLQAPCSLKK